jgi:hypothetical protein
MNLFGDMVELNSIATETICKTLLSTMEVYGFTNYYLKKI